MTTGGAYVVSSGRGRRTPTGAVVVGGQRHGCRQAGGGRRRPTERGVDRRGEPTTVAARTGRPWAKASSTTSGSASGAVEGTTTAAAARISSATAAGSSRPRTRTVGSLAAIATARSTDGLSDDRQRAERPAGPLPCVEQDRYALLRRESAHEQQAAAGRTRRAGVPDAVGSHHHALRCGEA